MGKRHRKRQYPDNWSRCRNCGGIYTLGEHLECEQSKERASPETASTEDAAEKSEDPEVPDSLAGPGSKSETPQGT